MKSNSTGCISEKKNSGGSEYCAQKFDRTVDKNRQTKIDRFWDPPILAKKKLGYTTTYIGELGFFGLKCAPNVADQSMQVSRNPITGKNPHHRHRQPMQIWAEIGQNWLCA